MKLRPNSPLTADVLLNKLLDRFESQRERVRDITQPINYKHVGGPAAQDDLHRVLKDAERSGGITLEKNRLGRFTGELARVRLLNAEMLYKFLGRSSAESIADATHSSIGASIPAIVKDPFFRNIVEDAAAAWRLNKRFLGLTPANINAFITVLRLTHGIINLAGRDIDHRTFSRRTVKDSKALEQLEGRVVQLLKRWNRNLEGDEPREILEACGIVRRAHVLFVKGPVRVSSDDLKLEGTGELFIGLPWSSVQRAALSRPVQYIITIENPTSFWRYCLEVKGCYLALLSDGFPARDVLSSMVHLVKSARSIQEAPIFHWGDIDAGGIRIAAHLEDAFEASIALHLMGPALALELGSPLQYRQGLAKLSTRNGDIGRLAVWLSGNEAMVLEQEELDPRSPME
ncbi:MAG: Wadjet anti-phage system protein JetD domain-containing protein [Terriglobales bacterium]